MGSGSVHVLILAGGSGTRLWPLSTEARPKPFLALSGPRSLLRETADRATTLVAGDLAEAISAAPSGAASRGGVWVSGRRAHAELIRSELPELPEERLLLEPMRRNTAPAIALAALAIQRLSGDDALVAVLPSDQSVKDEASFLGALRTGLETARSRQAIVTLGILPTRPETGFGYQETDVAERGSAVRRVLRYVEKPDLETCRAYMESGRFFWNAGIFLFRVGTLLEEMRRICPDILEAAGTACDARQAGDQDAFDRAFAAARSISIDYAVLEHARDVLTVPCSCGWTDLGSWEAVFEHRGGGPGRDVLDGPAVAAGGHGNLVLADGRTVRVVGLEGVAVVDSPDGLLVMKLGASDALRKCVEESLVKA